MNILFLVSSMHAGGAERVAATLANAWAQRGDSVTLVPTYTGKGTCFYPVDSQVELIWLADRIGPAGNPVSAGIKKIRALRALIRQKQPDVIVSFLTNVNVMALLGTRGTGVPVVVCERTNPAFSTNVGPVLRCLRRWTYPWADRVTVQAQASVASFKKMVPGIRHLDVIANPLPPELLDAPLAPRVPLRGRLRLAALGRLVPAKQFDRLIKAFARIAADYPDWDLVIWGEGPLRESLALQIRQAGLDARISLPGRTDQPWDDLARTHAFALVSAVEGFPNALLEAMALGLPCIAFDCPSGPHEITRGGQDALLVPAGDQAALTLALKRLLGDAALRDDLAGRAALSVRQRFSLPVILSQWDALLAQVRAPGPKDNQK